MSVKTQILFVVSNLFVKITRTKKCCANFFSKKSRASAQRADLRAKNLKSEKQVSIRITPRYNGQTEQRSKKWKIGN